MSKSTEKVMKKYADTYKWTDEVEQLLMVTKEYKTKQIAKSINWKSCVDKYGKILEALPSMYSLNSSASFTNDILDILKFSLHSSSIIVPLIKLPHHIFVLPGRFQNHSFFDFMMPTVYW